MTKMYIFGKNYKKNDVNEIINSLVYIGYRYGFSKLNNSLYVSDIGWGCTLRNGQMLLANVFLKHLLPNWKYKNHIPKKYYNIISNFRDNQSNIFSIHNLVDKYSLFDKKAGDWIGPYTVANLISEFKTTILNLYNIQYVCETSGIFDVTDYNILDNTYLITIPVRLGVEFITPEYYSNIRFLTKCESFMGIIGGNNNKSFYFIGSSGNKLIYLDPHTSTSYDSLENDISLYRAKTEQYLDIKDLSPTFTICFYINSETKLNEISNINNNIPNKKYPIFEIGNKTNIKQLECEIDDDTDWNIII